MLSHFLILRWHETWKFFLVQDKNLFIHVIICVSPQRPLLLAWINFNSSTDKWLHPLWSVGWNYLSIPKLQLFHCWSFGMDRSLHPTLYRTCNYLSILGLKFIHVSKRGPRCLLWVLSRKSSIYVIRLNVDVSCSAPTHSLRTLTWAKWATLMNDGMLVAKVVSCLSSDMISTQLCLGK